MSYIRFQSQDTSERFDGRLLFHDRRHNIHNDLIKWAQLSVKDPRYVGEWCASLMALHRLMWGAFERVLVTLERHPKNVRVRFNHYMETKLLIINRRILKSMTYIERGNGDIYIRADRNKLKHLCTALDKAQKEIASVEYSKNFDLPAKRSYMEEATDGSN